MKFKRKFSGGTVPERWLHCPPNGNRLILSKFMPLKTPLGSNFDNQVPPRLRYPPDEIFHIAEKNKVKIGLWIDLTNTNRYYHKEDVQKHNCKYVKIKCIGHGQAPTQSDTNLFISTIDNYTLRDPSSCIAVHCTHGFNRTGFLISAFLVERLKFDVGIAVRIFSEARPPGIYKEDYIKELFRRYGKIEDAPPAPSLPQWCEQLPSRKPKYKNYKSVNKAKVIRNR